MRHVIRWLCAVTMLMPTLIGAADLSSQDLLDSAKRNAERVEIEQGANSAEAGRAWQEYGDLLAKSGRNADAVSAIRKALAVRLMVLGENHADTAYTLDQLGWTLASTEGAAAAEAFFRRALVIREQVLGSDDPLTILSNQRLGLNLYTQSKFAEAEPYLRRGAESGFRVLGPATANSAYFMRVLGDVLNKLGRNPEAVAAYEKALTAAESAFGPESAEAALVLNNLGFAHTQLNQFASAISALQRAVAIRGKVSGAHRETAVALQNLATALFLAGEFDAGAVVADRALSIRETVLGSDDVEVASSLNQRAAYHQVKGEFALAERLAGRALGILESKVAPDDENLGVSIEMLAMVNEAQGRYSKALELSLKGLRVREAAFGSRDGQALRFLEDAARNRDNLARYAESESSYRKLVELRNNANEPDNVDLCGALTGLGDLYSRQGRYPEAEGLYRRTLDIRRHVYGPNHFLVAVSLSRLSRSLKWQRRYEEAEIDARQDVEILQRTLGDGFLTAVALEDLADIYEFQGKIAEATAIYERTIAIKERVFGSNHPAVAFSLGEYSWLLWLANRPDGAENARARQLSINLAALGPDHDSTATSYERLATIQAARGRWDEALRNYASAADILVKRSVNHLPSPTYAAPRAAESEIGRNKGRLINYIHAAYWGPVMLPGKASWDSRRVAAEKTFELIQWAQLSDTTAALSQMSLRAGSKNEQLAARVRESQDLSAEWRVADAQRSSLISNPGGGNQVSQAAARQRLAGIESRLADLNEWLKTNYPDYAELSLPRAVSANEARQILRSDEALVIFSLTPSDCFVWTVTSDAIQWTRLEVGQPALIEMVTALRQQLVGGRFNLNLAYGVYQAIFAPIEGQLEGKHLLVIPDGILTSLPLHLLVTQKPEASDENVSERYRHADWMIKSHAMTTLPSVSALKALRQRSPSSDATEPYLGIGNPLLLGRGGDDRRAWDLKKCSDLALPPRTISISSSSPAAGELPNLLRGATADVTEIGKLEPLPETVAELCGVAESFGHGNDAVLLGSEATEATVRRLSRDHLLANARVVHFATHGLVAGEIPGVAEPALVLTPPPDDGRAVSSDNDGLLTASEITQLDFNADWIVLSACDTAAGNSAGTEALSGLARAFFYAGTRALLVSHWTVNTDAAVKLMVGTFAIMARDPRIGRAEALRREMIEMIENGAAAETHPRYWAPFVIVGEGSAR